LDDNNGDNLIWWKIGSWRKTCCNIC